MERKGKERKVTFIAVVIIMSLEAPPFQLDDTLKPTGYDTPAECWLRTSVMTREVAMRTNVTWASGLCINNPPSTRKKSAEERSAQGKETCFR